jgi:hypothetical protein
MLREWADQDTHDMIDEALLPPARMLAATWDDDDAWSTFESAMRAENR